MIIPIDKSSLKMAYEEMDNRARKDKNKLSAARWNIRIQ